MQPSNKTPARVHPLSGSPPSRGREPTPSPLMGEARDGGVAPPTVRPIHGGIKPAQLRALELKPEDVLDFSASVSPIGPPPGVWEAMRRIDLTAYPDPQCLELREAISRHLSKRFPSPLIGEGQDRSELPKSLASLGLEQILVGNGSTELIHLLARAFLSYPHPGTTNTVFQLTPTYGEYMGACRLMGASISSLAAQRNSGFHWDLEDACHRIAVRRPSLVFLCNPNNPTGVYLHESEVEVLAEATADIGGLLVIDEAYISFVDRAWDSLALLERENVLLLRSMTKDYALTGLRLGYSLSSAEVTTHMASWQPDWSVNSLAQTAGVVALADTTYLTRAREAVAQSKDYLTAQLTALGFTVMPSAANFLLVQVGDGAALGDRLMRRGLFVRDCASFGLPDCIRIGIRALPDCQKLVQAVADVIQESDSLYSPQRRRECGEF